jgi:hypothetical protein
MIGAFFNVLLNRIDDPWVIAQLKYNTELTDSEMFAYLVSNGVDGDVADAAITQRPFFAAQNEYGRIEGNEHG